MQRLTTSDGISKPSDTAGLQMFKEGSASPATALRFSGNHDFRILLIDDNRDATDSMEALLTLLDYDVRTADDGESGLRMASDFQPHLILSDIGLPGMDGYQLAPELRKAVRLGKLILAAATGYGLASDRQKAREAGFDYHLVKPLDADMLLEFVARQMREY